MRPAPGAKDSGGRHPAAQVIQHRQTLIQLRQGNKFIRLVPLLHTSRPTNQGCHARFVKQPAFSAKGDGGERIISRPLRQPTGKGRLRIAQQAGILAERLKAIG